MLAYTNIQQQGVNGHLRVYGYTTCLLGHTVDLVIFSSLNFRKFPIWGLFTKFRIRELCLSVRKQDYLKINERICITLLSEVYVSQAEEQSISFGDL